MPAFLLEVGTEELPADFVEDAIAQWQSRIAPSLEEQFLTPGSVQVYGTPRRLAVVIRDLPAAQSDREEEIKGPPAKVAFKDGQPTKAAQGFARKQGVELDDLELRDTKKGEFVFVRKHIAGRAAAEILTELAPQWILGLEGRRFMRWSDGDLRFPRPIRWLVALLDDEIIPITLESGSIQLNSDRYSQGHRVLHPDPIEIPRASDYLDRLQAASIQVDPQQRRHKIIEQVEQCARQVGGTVGSVPGLLDEVTQLVEWPVAVLGKFDEDFLILPPEAIATVMVTHQRYFPVQKSKDSNELLPYFITVSNGDPDKSDIIASGNERVIRARLADGEFFYKTDISHPLDSYVAKLEDVTFQEDLGSIAEKVRRLTKVAERISQQLQLNQTESQHVERAAYLCKADLVTQMVYEFPELQGIIGEKYAIASDEPPEVAKAIFEHYLPRGADDILPETTTGRIVGLADRIDTLVSIFGLGMIPSGSSDPFALRRAANAVVNVTWSAELPINLDRLLQQTATDFSSVHPQADIPLLLQQLREFFLQRIQTLLQEDRNIDYDLVNAVLGENDREYAERALTNLLDVRDRAEFLQEIRNNGTLGTIYETVNRSARLASKGDLDTAQLDPQAVIDPGQFQKSSEQAFYEALVQLIPKTEAARSQRNYPQLIEALAEIAPTVSEFFDGENSVLVMDPDPNIQRNRLNLLGLLRNHARVLADFEPIVKN